MFSHFFIERPIFASVLSIVIALAGAVAAVNLPVAQYPPITPPSIMVSCTYPGADARVVAESVAAPIEQQVNGVEDMMYMVSQSNNDGSYTLTVTFKPGVNLNFAQVLVQNRINLALPLLPDVVKQAGVTTRKRNPDILLVIGVFSPHGTYDQIYLSNYTTIKLKDEIARVDGVGDVNQFGSQDYSMRLWIDPGRLAELNLTAGDVVAAVREQNMQVAAGHLGQQPARRGAAFEFPITVLGRLTDPEQFADIVLRTTPDGRPVRVRDVGRVEMGARNLDSTSKLNGQYNASLAVWALPDANSIATADRVVARMEQLKKSFPEDMDYVISLDMTPFIKESIHEVIRTLVEAVALVAAVVLLFLQNWRSALIPLLAVPVAIVGTFAVMAAIGFSLNNLTLFGLVLAIGIVVDDAIVVVEAVEHHVEEGLAPRDATIRAMEQVSGPVVAIGLVLSAVFVPCAFITGITGQFFRQFALTIAVSTVISAFNSLTLSPALAALLLKRREKGHFEALPWWAFAPFGTWLGHKLGAHYGEQALAALHLGLAPAAQELLRAWAPPVAGALAAALVGLALGRPINALLGLSFRAFNRGFDMSTGAYTRSVGGLLRVSPAMIAVYGGLLALTWWDFTHTPTGFIPQQDKGYLLVNAQLPDASSLGRTDDVVRRIEDIARSTPGVKHTVAISGQSILLNANASNFGALYLMLDDFDRRDVPELSADAIAARLQERFQREVPRATVNIFGAPPVEGLGTAGGFKIIVQDTGDSGTHALQDSADRVVVSGSENRNLSGLFTSFRADTPWLELVIDRAQPGFRQSVEDIKLLQVRNGAGDMVPLAAFATARWVSGPVMVMRYNMYSAAEVHADPSPGTSSGQAIGALETTANGQLPNTMRTEWTELALLQLQTGNTAMYVFALAVLLVFLVLAAQYESWALPLAVILVVPMCLLCSVAGVGFARMDINIFTQIGFLVLVGLACKNAILIVEFAKAQREAGVSAREATLAACRLRLRPIIMTSFAFILGVVPLVVSAGAGAEMRRTLGTAVFAGMLGVTLFGIFLTPVFYFVIQWLADRRVARPGRDEG